MSALISHAVSPEDLKITVKKIAERLQQQTHLPAATINQQLDLLQQLSQFDFGRFLLQHHGINGYWTHYMLTYPWFGKKTNKNNRGDEFSDLERFILERLPFLLATRQRFETFLAEIQKSVIDGARLASIPCGMLGELLYLNVDDVKDIRLTGIDYDRTALEDARELATQRNLSHITHLIQRDAWQLDIHEEFDLISSNGLNLYEPNSDRVTELYRQFYQALKPGGKLVTSFATPPPSLTDKCEWDMQQINMEDAALQRTLLVDIIQGKWQCFRSTEETRGQLTAAGFTDMRFIYDNARMFPTVVAVKL